MRTSHIYLSLVALATLGVVVAAPAAAQVADTAMQAEPELNTQQRADFEAWPAAQQAAYELWPAETKSYYWSLVPERRMLFWRLSDEDKIALTAMSGPERDAAWGQIESRASNPPDDG